MSIFSRDKVRPQEPAAANDIQDWERQVETVKQRIRIAGSPYVRVTDTCKSVGGHLWKSPKSSNTECEACGAPHTHDTDGGY